MMKSHDELIEQNLERLRLEVVVIADNLQALTYHPDMMVKDGITHVDKSTELYLSFWHEPIDPLDTMA